VEALEDVAKGGGILPPGVVSEGALIDTIENAAESSLFGRGVILKARAGAESIATRAADDFVSVFRRLGTRENVGELVQAALVGGREAFEAENKRLFTSVDRLAKGVRVDLTPLKAQARRLAEQAEKGLGSPTIQKITRRILGKADEVSFGEAQILRSDLLAVTRQSTDLVPNKAIGAAKDLAKLTDTRMTTAATTSRRPDLVDAFRKANQFFKEGVQDFNSSLVKSLFRSDPETVFATAIKGQRPGSIRRIRSLIDDPELWRGVQGQFARDLLANSLEPGGGGTLLGKKLVNNLRAFGDDALHELFSVDEIANLKRVSRTLEVVQSAPDKSKVGGMLIQLAQAVYQPSICQLDYPRAPSTAWEPYSPPGILTGRCTSGPRWC
jgi:hypothetical protein